jgi:branched-chain amino acid transport system permease protein
LPSGLDGLKSLTKRRQIPAVLLVLFLLTMPLYAQTYWVHVFCLVFVWVIMGHSWNLLGGYTGQPSFGHAAFFGTGAYTAGIIAVHLKLPLWLGMIAGIPTAVVAGLIIGWICFRLRGPYFALSTLAMGEMFRIIALNWKSVTLGARGMLVIPELNKVQLYYMGLVACALLTWLMSRIVRSKLGYYFQAIREDQDAAESMGIDLKRYKTIATGISTAMGGVAGAYYMNLMGYIDPMGVFSLPMISIMAIMVAILGGPGTISGPIIGAMIMVLVNEYLRRYIGAGAAMFIFGAVLVLAIIVLPNGIVGEWGRIVRFFRPRRSGRAVGRAA